MPCDNAAGATETKMNKRTIRLIAVLSTTFFTMKAGAQDTTIYKMVPDPPRFPGCERMDTTDAVKNQCAQASLLLFFNQNMEYPWEAREKDIAGTVVLSLVVEKDGTVSRPEILKDIGGGCGEEVLRVANGMNEALRLAGMAWKPGRKDGMPVRTQVVVPIKFKLETPPDFVLLDGVDTVYVALDDSVRFKGGASAMQNFLQARQQVPDKYRDSCFAGVMNLSILTRPDGYVRVVDLTDHWGLGADFEWEAIRTATATWGKWTPAVRNGRSVPALVDLPLTFLSDTHRCADKAADFHEALSLSMEGSSLFNEGKQAEGVEKLNRAIELFPDNTDFRYLRGQAYMNMNELEKACADFRLVQARVSIGMVEQLVPMICQ
ncbi:MAG: hypothetical protein RLY31_2057 [Bacteroidota bacterium]|jgi:hypothetical protein